MVIAVGDFTCCNSLVRLQLERMTKVTPVVMSRLALYFGLIKTTMTNQLRDASFFIRLLEDILAFKTYVLTTKDDLPRLSCLSRCSRDATIMVGIAKALETYSEALT